jgi:methionyl-tRNA formyltransferase
MKVGVLTGGNLGKETLEKIIRSFEVVFVLTDCNSQGVLKLCKENKVPFLKGNPRKGKGYNFIKNIEVDVIASVNYLFLIEKDIIQHSKLLTFNVHGSLLPKYRGRTPHVWAIINNEKETGITAHVIDEGCDTGDIISQIKIRIEEHDTGNDILNKYKLEYFSLIKEVFRKLNTEHLELIKQDENFATYFGVRKPENGKINWNWQKERIYNWIRAQAKPYPGAYTYFEGKKLIIDRIIYSKVGYVDEMPNGLVLSADPFLIKTPNGVVELCEVRHFEFEIKANKFLD